MLEIGDTVVSFDLFEHKFCCDLSVCRGRCCVEGDAGAPLTEEEVKKLDKVLPAVRQFLSARALEVIDSQGTSYVDADGDNVTSLVDGRECVFTYFENGICLCALEKAYYAGLPCEQLPYGRFSLLPFWLLVVECRLKPPPR